MKQAQRQESKNFSGVSSTLVATVFLTTAAAAFFAYKYNDATINGLQTHWTEVAKENLGLSQHLNPAIKAVSFAEEGELKRSYDSSDWQLVFDQLLKTKPMAIILSPRVRSFIADDNFLNHYIDNLNEQATIFLDTAAFQWQGTRRILMPPNFPTKAQSGYIDSHDLNGIFPEIHWGDEDIPYAPLLLDRDLKIKKSGVYVDSTAIPTDYRGTLLPLAISPSEIEPRFVRLDTLYEQVEWGGLSKFFAPGDVIFFGFEPTDRLLVKDGFSAIPAIATANSVLNKRWGKGLGNPLAIAAVLILILAGLAYKKTIVAFRQFCMCAVLGFPVLGTGLWISQDVHIPWLLPTLCLALLWFGWEVCIYGSTRGVLISAKSLITGRINDAELWKISTADLPHLNTATEQVVSILAIDLMIHGPSAREFGQFMIERVRKMEAEMKEIIFRHRGVIDVATNEGIVAFFGSNLFSTPDGYHADSALRCARELQHVFLGRGSDRNKLIPAVPIRIGVHCAAALIEAPLSRKPSDQLLFGPGVSFTNLLSRCADPFRIVASKNCLDLISDETLKHLPFTKIVLNQSKVDGDRAEGFLFQVSVEFQSALIEQEKEYIELLKMDRSESRHAVLDSVKIYADTIVGRGRIENFSKSGFSLVLPEMLAVGLKIEIELDTEGGVLGKLLRNSHIFPVIAEIRLASSDEGRFVHGVRIIEFSDIEKETLFTALKSQNVANSNSLNLVRGS